MNRSYWKVTMFDGRIISGITVFAAVAEAGSYSRASESLGLSRSGVGKTIARLEGRTGLRLFDRTSRALKLTPDGRHLLNVVRPLLERLDEAAAPRERGEVRGHLRVSCDAAFGTYLLAPIIHNLFEQHPRLKVDLLIRDRIDNLLAEGVDVAVRFGEPEARDLQKRLLFKCRVVACASSEYVRRRGLPSCPSDLLDGHNCIRLIDDVSGKPHNWVFEREDGERHEVAPDCNLTVNDAPSLLASVASGFGIARALDFMIDDGLRTGRLVEVLPGWNNRPWPAYLYTAKRAHASAGLEAFSSFVLAQSFGIQADPGGSKQVPSDDTGRRTLRAPG